MTTEALPGPIRTEAAAGLLSLSLAAATATPIQVHLEKAQDVTTLQMSSNLKSGSSLCAGGGSIGTSTKGHAPAGKHRRLSTSGQARRRLSDAREAASRPSPVTISTAAAALSSLAKLSLSGSPPPQTTFVSASGVIMNRTASEASTQPSSSILKKEANDEVDLNGTGISVSNAKSGTGKKRGTIFKCESCSKVYRHPSCLIKHRWEHSPHWREASKLLLSKHQQVQLLEAAAILSHLSASGSSGTSLPEDRSLWPSYLSGGLLPPPSPANTVSSASTKPTMSTFVLEQPAPFPTSSSVPAPSVLSTSLRSSSRGSSSGPRLHDYSVSRSSGVTQLRPGVLAVPTGSESRPPSVDVVVTQLAPIQRSAAVPMPNANTHPNRSRELGYSFVSQSSDAWSSPISVGFAQSSFRSSASASMFDRSYSDGTSGWSLPRSSMRSSPRSRSGSIESEFVDIDGFVDTDDGRKFGFSARPKWNYESVRVHSAGHEKIDEEWDGMEMEMEM